MDNNNDDKKDDQNTDSGEKDSGDTAVDTAPPPPCPVMEEEPNGDYDTAQIVQMEKWICGTFDEASESAADLDVFSFTTAEEGWVKMWARGQDIGSSAIDAHHKIGNETACRHFPLKFRSHFDCTCRKVPLYLLPSKTKAMILERIYSMRPCSHL